MRPDALMLLLLVAGSPAADLSATTYLAGRSYQHHGSKEHAVYAGAYAARHDHWLTLEAEIDHSAIAAGSDIAQYDATLVLSSGSAWRDGGLRLGARLISSDDAWTDRVYTGIIGGHYRVHEHWRLGFDGFASRYSRWNAGMTVLQASPWAAWNVAFDDGWWMDDRVTLSTIHLDRPDSYSGLRSSDVAIANRLQIGHGAWSLDINLRVGNFRFGHERAGFIVNNGPDDLQTTLALGGTWYGRDGWSLGLRLRHDDIVGSDGSDSSSELVALLSSWRF